MARDPKQQDVPVAEEAREFARDLAPGDQPRILNALGSLCTQLRNGEAAVLEEYLRQSPLCAELLDLWQVTEKRIQESGDGVRVIVLLLEVLAFILEGRGEAYTPKTRTGVATRIMSERLTYIYRHLKSERDQMLRACLRVLAGIAGQSATLASQMLRTFNFQQEGFFGLAKRRIFVSSHEGKDPKKKKHRAAEEHRPQDVRTFYVRFALNLLRWKDQTLSSGVLTVKGFLSPIFAGLKEDKPEDVCSILKDMRELVLEPKYIPRHSKLFLFASFTLHRLCGLLCAESADVVRAGQEFLTALVTDTFIFRHQQTHLLMDVCQDLKPLRLPQQEVILAVLQTHPAVHIAFLSKFQMSLQMNVNYQWVSNVRFLMKVLQLSVSELPAQVAQMAAGHEAGFREVQLSWVLRIFAPRALQKNFLTLGLQSEDGRVLYSTLLLLNALLGRIRAARAAGLADGDCAEEVMQRVQQNLPDISVLVKSWQARLQDTLQVGRAQTAKQVLHKSYHMDVDEEAEGEDHLDEMEVPALLGRPGNIITCHGIFAEWCQVLRGYMEVVPNSLLDSRFDWSKLLVEVAAPLLKGKELPTAAIERFVPCIHTVSAAMGSRDGFVAMHLTRSQLSWIEALVQIRSAATESLLKDRTQEIRGLCDGILHRVFQSIGVFGTDAAAEVNLWLMQLKAKPLCLPFFLEVLRSVTSKPGYFASLLSAKDDDDEGMEVDVGSDAPSLLFTVAVRQLLKKEAAAQPKDAAKKEGAAKKPVKDETAKKALANAEFLRDLTSQLSATMPQMTSSIAKLLRESGQWHNSEKDDQSGGCEDIRQDLLCKLEASVKAWSGKEKKDDSGERPSKRRRPEAAPAGPAGHELRMRTVLGALRGLADLPRETEDQDASSASFEAASAEVTRALESGEPYAHSGAYVLLEGLRSCACAEVPDWGRAVWHLLWLVDGVPAMVAASGPVLQHTLSHPVWTTLVEVDTDAEDDAERGACLVLAFAFLCRLLLACTGPEPERVAGRMSLSRLACEKALLPLLGVAPFEAKLRKSVRKAVAARAQLQPWIADAVAAAAEDAVTLCSRTGCLTSLVALSVERDLLQIAVARALLRARDGAPPPVLQLPARLRADLLSALAKAAAHQAAEGEETSSADAAGDIGGVLRDVLALDRGGLLCLALSGVKGVPWVNAKKGTKPLHKDILPLIKQACWVNPALREKVAQKLSWNTCAPSLALELAACLAPLGQALPFLEGDGAADVAAEALLPLPPKDQLQRLLRIHDSPAILEMLQRASAGSPAAPVIVAQGAGLPEEALSEAVAQAEAKIAANADAALDIVSDVCTVVGRLAAAPGKSGRKGLKRLTAALVDTCPQAAAILLSASLARTDGAPETWLCEAAAQVAAADCGSEWHLAHLALWWHHLSAEQRSAKVLGRVRSAYLVTLSRADRLRRQVLAADAAGASSPCSAGAASSADPWSFREWCGTMRVWGDAAWSWTLDGHRVRATVDAFWFSRPMADGAPWLHTGVCPEALPTMPPAEVDATSALQAQPYDMGYLAPFLAGHLRSTWAEHTQATPEDARAILGPVLGAMTSGGGLELLILACACEDVQIRACAHEGLSVVMAMIRLWGDEGQARETKKLQFPFKELPQVARLLTYTRDTLESPGDGSVPSPMPRLVASFLCASVPVLLTPGHFAFRTVGFALCGDTAADRGDIPVFYKMLLCGEAESHEARVWIFKVIRRGLAGQEVGADAEFGDSVPALANQETAKFLKIALLRRYAMQWLLSFATSHELGSFGLWSDATSCLAAALTQCGATAPQSLGIAEWVTSQVARQWPGTCGALHRTKAMESLTQLVSVLASRCAVPAGIAARASNVLTLCQALRAVSEGWLQDALDGGAAAAAVPLLTLWDAAHRLADLSRPDRGKESSAEGGCMMSSTRCACSAQLGLILHSLSRLAAGPAQAGAQAAVRAEALLGAVAARKEPTTFMAETLTILGACPESQVAHHLVLLTVRRALLPAPAGPSEDTSSASAMATIDLLSDNVQRHVVFALASLVDATHNSGDCRALRTTVVPLAHTLAALPYQPQVGWRVHSLVCVLLLEVFPDALPEGDLCELAADLPGPQVALAGMGSMGPIPADGDQEGVAWRIGAAKLLGHLVGACDEH